jgi:hypothetical protein
LGVVAVADGVSGYETVHKYITIHFYHPKILGMKLTTKTSYITDTKTSFVSSTPPVSFFVWLVENLMILL